MRFSEFTKTEIEFVCVNKDVPGSTLPEQQDALFDALKKIPNIIVYRQDFDEDEEVFSGGKSMAVILKDKSSGNKVKQLAKRHGVKIDLTTQISERDIDRRITDPATTDWYDTDYL